MRPLHSAARGVVAQGGEVHVEVVVGWMVVEVHSQLVGCDPVSLLNGFLRRAEEARRFHQDVGYILHSEGGHSVEQLAQSCTVGRHSGGLKR